ncbi:MAG: hypothetical protein CL946_09615 [Ectothiorhodospiraceae bacterium]|nr:hypothetical protein [Ectothiorhodospiraceae bacterium]
MKIAHKIIAVNLFVVTALCLFISCDDHGISPKAGKELPGFGGTLLVTSEWSPADSLFDLRVVAFRNYPPGDLVQELLDGNAVFSDTLQFNVETQSYTIEDAELAGTFEYVAVAQQYGSNLFTDWRAVGVFTESGDPAEPSPVSLGSGQYIQGVDITIDFYDLPPQPF